MSMLKLTVEIGGDVVLLSIIDAKNLYMELKEVFGDEELVTIKPPLTAREDEAKDQFAPIYRGAK